ncbi:PH-like domain-containing protein [Glaciibacter psychrotolerans]|uniref:PH domain-containing protein n=1 Tax=Glaciibacter psychrotolerans TaxID=670054 RepID=A0A7Z0ECH6_9MICO|nr:hypothetical protein [Leifsonia psychrotolerans]NYJ19106.1 hypothetical protein [Leifsonia psychrotolerans]
MDKLIPGVIVVVVLLGLLALMWRSWMRRSRRDAALTAGYPAPLSGTADTTSVRAEAPVLYVATTPRGEPLERLAIRNLAFRARATLRVTGPGVSAVDRAIAPGLTIVPTGEEPVYVPAEAIELVTEATWAIDRAVETGGLLLVGWRLAATEAGPNGPATGGASVDSYFRITDPADRGRIVDALRSIAPGASSPDLSTESEA